MNGWRYTLMETPEWEPQHLPEIGPRVYLAERIPAVDLNDLLFDELNGWQWYQEVALLTIQGDLLITPDRADRELVQRLRAQPPEQRWETLQSHLRSEAQRCFRSALQRFGHIELAEVPSDPDSQQHQLVETLRRALDRRPDSGLPVVHLLYTAAALLCALSDIRSYPFSTYKHAVSLWPFLDARRTEQIGAIGIYELRG